MKSKTVSDALGRVWERSSFKLFDTTHVFTYCHDLPEGSICMARIFNVFNDYLLKMVEFNFRKFILSHLLINPYFWEKSKLFNYLKSEPLKKHKILAGIGVEEREGSPWFSIKSFPFQFTIPDMEKVESIRIQSGLYGESSQKAQWTGYGVEWVRRGEKEDQVCGIGLEPFSSKSRFPLNYLRDRRKQEKLKVMKGDDPDPLPGIWYKLFKKNVPKPFQIYGYCAPLVKDPRTEDDHFVDFKKAKALKYKYKIE